ncbi:MAG: thymidylate synthase [Acidithiobacillus sp.]|jgi:thymidylate synthase|uniref:thymidylate synthase n=1 Tax=Acidithiobacillus sp. TaxID=1872118 RepID=UPI00355EF41D
MEWINRTADSFDSAYSIMINDLYNNGIEVTPRGMPTLECNNYIIKIENPRKRIITNQKRHLSAGFLVAEFLWIISGNDNIDMISYYNKQWLNFTDTSFSGENYLNGPYGPRIRNWYGIDQLYEVYNKLKNDKDSRQAVIAIFDPQRDFKIRKDIPCNDFIQFSIRENKLNMSVYVRSQDILFGFPYDIFHWTMMQEILASMLNVELGYYVNYSNSLHMYLRNEKTVSLIKDEYKDNFNFNDIPEMVEMPQIDSFNTFNDLIKTMCNIEKLIRLNNEPVIQIFNILDSKHNYWKDLLHVLFCFKKFKYYGTCKEMENKNFINDYWKMLFINYQLAKSTGNVHGAIYSEK